MLVLLTLIQTISCLEPIKQLTLSNIDKVIQEMIQENKALLLNIQHRHCNPCKAFYEDYKQLNNELKEYNIQLATFDGYEDSEKQVINKYKVNVYPTIILINDGRVFKFDGTLAHDMLLQWTQQMLNTQNPTEINNEQELQQIRKESETLLFYQLQDENDSNFVTFIQVAKSTNGIQFCFSRNLFLHKGGSLILYYKNEQYIFQKAFTIQNIKSFIQSTLLPLVPRINNSIYQSIYRQDVPSLILFMGINDQQILNDFTQIAQKFKQYQFSYTVLTDETFFDDLYELGADDGIIPKIIIMNQGKKYKYNGPDFTYENLKNLIIDFRSGLLNQYYKSEPIPIQQYNSQIFELVGLTFNQYVLQSNQHVLIEFYAKWSQASQRFQPEFERIAYELKNETNLFIARINYPDNDDIPYLARGFPEVVFYKAGEKKDPQILITNVVEYVRKQIH